jgi:hypothetical protein
MGLMDINTKMIELFDRITLNLAPLVTLNATEVNMVIPVFVPPSRTHRVIDTTNPPASALAVAGKPISKGTRGELPLLELLSRLRKKSFPLLVMATGGPMWSRIIRIHIQSSSATSSLVFMPIFDPLYYFCCVIASVECHSLWMGGHNMEPFGIPSDCDHQFSGLNHVSFSV